MVNEKVEPLFGFDSTQNLALRVSTLLLYIAKPTPVFSEGN